MSRKRLRDIAARRGEDYWGGATWAFHVATLNGAGASGNHDMFVTPGEDNEMEVLYGGIFNGDVVSRNQFCRILDREGNILDHLIREVSLGQNDQSYMVAYATDTQGGGIGGRHIVSGEMQVGFRLAAIAVSQNSAFNLVARLRGDRRPTVTFNIPAGATTTIVEEME